MSSERIETIVILGGGAAGWAAASGLIKSLPKQVVNVILVESDDIGIVGVGESTIPPFLDFLDFLDIDETDFIKKTQATYKLGIKFQDWRAQGESYWHPFGKIGVGFEGIEFYRCWNRVRDNDYRSKFTDFSPSSIMCEKGRFLNPTGSPRESFLSGVQYAFHLDAGLCADYLRKYSERRGVRRMEGKVVSVSQADNGFIDMLTLEDGRTVQGDFFIDCSGFRSELIEKTLNAGYESWRRFLPCDRAVAVQTGRKEKINPYTISVARDSGWSWQIPLQNRTGNGYVYDSNYCTEEQAVDDLLTFVSGDLVKDPISIPFTTGVRRNIWYKNCLSIGLSAGFLEPLESTSIYLITKGVALFLSMIPDKTCDPVLAREYNRIMSAEYESVRDFIVLHYCTSERRDSPFWRACGNLELPDTLQEKIDLFKSQGLLYNNPSDLFKPASWYSVFEGMGVRPEKHDPRTDNLDIQQLQVVLDKLRSGISTMVESLPEHTDYINVHCSAPVPQLNS